MNRLPVRRWLIAGLCLVPAIAAAAQMPPMPTPGPEHAVLKEDVGTWDAAVELMGPDGNAIASKGIETNTLACNGMCLVTEFKGELMPGMAFAGAGITAYDSKVKKYVGTWSDSMTPGLASSESTWDAGAKKMTGTMKSTDPMGQPSTSRSVVEYPAAGKRVMTLYTPGPDGKEALTMRITYTKRP
jgi:uncharacterized protein DUF1579